VRDINVEYVFLFRRREEEQSKRERLKGGKEGMKLMKGKKRSLAKDTGSWKINGDS